MININPMLLCDFYKTTHSKQFPAGTTKLVSYFTPRMSRLDGVDEVVVFGIQAFCKDYLTNYFNDNFFDEPKGMVVPQYKRYLDATIGKDAKDTDDAMQQALEKYDNGELESYEDEFESAFAESEDD